MNRPRKTTRNYGQKWNLIREFAAVFDGPFTPHVFTPAIGYLHAVAACRELAERGEITLLLPGLCGRYTKRPPLYICRKATRI